MEKIGDVKSQLKISLSITFESLINILMSLVDTLVISLARIKEFGAMDAILI